MNISIMDSVQEAKKILVKKQESISFQKGAREGELARKKSISDELNSFYVDEIEQCSLLFQKISSFKRELARKRLEELGTMALQYSMGADYEMMIEVGDDKKKPTIEVYVLHVPTKLRTSPLDDNGGGIVDILSVALRVMVLQMVDDPVIDGPIILDEPFKMASEEYIPMISNFLKKISEDFGRQIIMVTHNVYLGETCDSMIKVTRDGAKNESMAVNIK